jgi:hypothetical protein
MMLLEVVVAETDDWTDGLLAWADDKQVTIKFVDYVDQPPREIWRFNLSAEEIDVDQATKELLRFTQELKPGIEFTLDVMRSYISWGQTPRHSKSYSLSAQFFLARFR